MLKQNYFFCNNHTEGDYTFFFFFSPRMQCTDIKLKQSFTVSSIRIFIILYGRGPQHT